jgi:TonB family protein
VSVAGSLALGLVLGLAAPLAAAAADKPAPATPPAKAVDADRMPVPKKQTVPVYPKALFDKNITGLVVVGFIIDEKGNVPDAWAIESPDPAFSKAAIDCVKQWKFTPALKGGKPVKMNMSVDIRFNTKERPAGK